MKIRRISGCVIFKPGAANELLPEGLFWVKIKNYIERRLEMLKESAVTKRFLRYVKIDTQSSEDATTYPSSSGQLELGKLLVSELLEIGISDARMDEFGIVMGTLPATAAQEVPTIAWIAHMDTSPETSGKDVKAVVHANYNGRDIVLPGNSNKVLKVKDYPELKKYRGATLITSDGTTLLGADDKAGMAVIMDAAAFLLAHPEIQHGPIRLVFTCDEEIGQGTKHLRPEKINATVAYTLDGDSSGQIDVETFSADKAEVTIEGVNIHPSIGKGRLVNSIRIAAEFIAALPRAMSPERTDKRLGFIHPYVIEGGVAKTTVQLILRDFVTAKLKDEAAILKRIVKRLSKKYPKAKIDVAITKQYRNMRDGLIKEPRAIAFAEEAVRRAGLTPKKTIVRGGTDGSSLTEMGLPTPNLSCGDHVPHSPLEWAVVEEMEKCRDVLIELAKVWAEKGAPRK